MKNFCWAFMFCMASAASAQDSVRLLPTPLEMPARIGPLVFDGKPHKYEPAALGYSYQYNGSGLSLTVYVYDAGAANIPDGGDTVPNCYIFEQTKREIAAAGYSDVRLVSEQLVRLAPPGDAPLAREAVFEFVRGGQPTISWVWVTGVAKHFVKIRFSMGTNLRVEAEEARRFLLDALGAAVKPHLAPVAAGAGGSAVTLNVFAGAGPEEMAAGIAYLSLLATHLDKQPEEKPLCGGQYVPPYETELSAFRSLLAMNLPGAAGNLSRQLAPLAEAGFLEEFVWAELHRTEWGIATPDGLALADYQAWRATNLQGFRRPQLGAVIINRPRPMQIETPATP